METSKLVWGTIYYTQVAPHLISTYMFVAHFLLRCVEVVAMWLDCAPSFVSRNISCACHIHLVHITCLLSRNANPPTTIVNIPYVTFALCEVLHTKSLE